MSLPDYHMNPQPVSETPNPYLTLIIWLIAFSIFLVVLILLLTKD